MSRHDAEARPLARFIHQGSRFNGSAAIAGRVEPWRRRRDDRGLVVRQDGFGGGTLPRGQGGRSMARAASSAKPSR